MSGFKALLAVSIALFVLIGCAQDKPNEPGNPQLSASSDTPLVVMTQPASGAIFVNAITIAWSATDPDDGETALLDIDIEYSDDAGTAWMVIDTNQTNDGAYRWDVSGMPDGIEYLVRITATDPSGLSATAESEAVFYIIRPIYITDRTNKEWEISYAVYFYNMEAQNWQNGLGPHAIKPINVPEMLSPGDQDYPAESFDERIVGINIDGDARAYPISALTTHHVVNDSVGGFPLSVIYCPLLDRAAAGSRWLCACTPVLTLADSGWLFGSTFVLWDYETESLWVSNMGEPGFLTSVSGLFADQILEEYPSTIATWNEWKTSNPNTKYMKHQ